MEDKSKFNTSATDFYDSELTTDAVKKSVERHLAKEDHHAKRIGSKYTDEMEEAGKTQRAAHAIDQRANALQNNREANTWEEQRNEAEKVNRELAGEHTVEANRAAAVTGSNDAALSKLKPLSKATYQRLTDAAEKERLEKWYGGEYNTPTSGYEDGAQVKTRANTELENGYGGERSTPISGYEDESFTRPIIRKANIKNYADRGLEGRGTSPQDHVLSKSDLSHIDKHRQKVKKDRVAAEKRKFADAIEANGNLDRNLSYTKSTKLRSFGDALSETIENHKAGKLERLFKWMGMNNVSERLRTRGVMKEMAEEYGMKSSRPGLLRTITSRSAIDKGMLDHEHGYYKVMNKQLREMKQATASGRMTSEEFMTNATGARKVRDFNKVMGRELSHKLGFKGKLGIAAGVLALTGITASMFAGGHKSNAELYNPNPQAQYYS